MKIDLSELQKKESALSQEAEKQMIYAQRLIGAVQVIRDLIKEEINSLEPPEAEPPV